MTRALLLCLALAACATPPPACPPVIPYTAAEQDRAADELHALPPDAELRRMMGDYLLTRDRIRAACP